MELCVAVRLVTPETGVVGVQDDGEVEELIPHVRAEVGKEWAGYVMPEIDEDSFAGAKVDSLLLDCVLKKG